MLMRRRLEASRRVLDVRIVRREQRRRERNEHQRDRQQKPGREGEVAEEALEKLHCVILTLSVAKAKDPPRKRVADSSPSARLGMTPLLQFDSRIDNSIKQVTQKIHEDVSQRDHQDRRLHLRVVSI